MSKKLAVCVNHPDRYTSRRCYYCHKPICSECQKIYSHHLFCSRTCWYRFLIREKSQVFLRKTQNMLVALRRQQIPLLWLILVMISVVLIIQNHQMRQAIHSLKVNEPLVLMPTNPAQVKMPSRKAALRVQQPAPGAMIFQNSIQVKGEARDGFILALVDSTGPLAVTLPKKGKFEFPLLRISPRDRHLWVKAITGEGKTVELEKIDFHFAPLRFRIWATPIRRGNLAQRKVALTFDGGGSNNVAGDILAILKSRNVQATMFLTGQFLQRYPETVRQIVRDGHEVGNHTFDHPHLTTYAENHRHYTRPGVTRQFIQNELRKTADLFYQITGQTMAPFWRPPYGESNQQIRQWAAEAGFREVDWTLGKDRQDNMDTRDWIAEPDAPGYQTAEEIERKILNFARQGAVGANGAIILMHLGSNRRDDFPHKRLPAIIDSLRHDGYRFVTISALLPQKIKK